MMGLFTPRFVKNGKELLHAARKMLAYKRDLLKPADLALVENQLARLKSALTRRDEPEVTAVSQELEQFFGGRFPTPKNAELRENCEVFLVAIVIALGIRTFFLQPFTIPTGSMQPTLNGIIVTPTESLPPNPLVRAGHMAWYGRSYFNIVSKENDRIVSITDQRWLWFFSYARITCVHQTLYVPAPAETVQREFDLHPNQQLRAGEVVARGYVDTGDHVFVNKMAYNFRSPRRGEVFVFNTAGVITPLGQPSQFYIKRLVGTPGDELRVDPPVLYINGFPATGPAFERVMAGTYERPVDGYKGYCNGPRYLTSPQSTFRLPPNHYFAMGDNSYNSSDSRVWGTVPAKNLVGCGTFVYWPFGRHWGLIQ